MIDTLDAQLGRCKENEAVSVFDLLAFLSTVDRFPLTVAFLSAAQKQHTASLLNWLHKHAPLTTATAQPSSAAEEAKEQLTTGGDAQPVAVVQSVGGSASVSTSSLTPTSISAHPRSRLPLQLPSSSTTSSYPMLVPGWSSFSSPSVSSASATPTALTQQSTHKASSHAAVRVPKLPFDTAGVHQLRKRFKLVEQ